jgi:hypothetical protein
MEIFDMSDKYFKDKAKDLLSRIVDEYEANKDEEDMETLICFCLKEVARDQRYACVEKVGNYTDSAICGIIKNTEIEDK